MRALVVYHHNEKDIGSFKPILERRGFEVDYIYGADDKTLDHDPLTHDLAIVMGGSMGVYESDQYPYLLNEISYLKKRLDNDLPTLGICLGGQLMAKSLGGDVYKGTNDKETGWREIEVTPAGEQSPVRHLDALYTKMTQGHQDTFDLPTNCTLLASSDQYKNQVFSHGKKALGFQCHPEMTVDLIDAWLNKKDDFLTTQTMSKERIVEDTKIYIETLTQQTEKFLNEWLDEVGFNKNA